MKAFYDLLVDFTLFCLLGLMCGGVLLLSLMLPAAVIH